MIIRRPAASAAVAACLVLALSGCGEESAYDRCVDRATESWKKQQERKFDNGEDTGSILDGVRDLDLYVYDRCGAENEVTSAAELASEEPTPTQASESPEPEKPSDTRRQACAFVPYDELNDKLSASLGGDWLAYSTDNSASYVDNPTLVCTLNLPESHRMMVYDRALEIRRWRYDDPLAGSTAGLPGTNCKLGGSSPKQVYEQTYACSLKISAAMYPFLDDSTTRTPSGKGGITVDGGNSIAYVASPGDFWFQVTLYGEPGEDFLSEELTTIGKELLRP